MAVGARQAAKTDPVFVESQNERLRKFAFGKAVKELRKKDPKAWRSRAFRRRDMQKKLKGVFMKISEQQNCTFEPQAGNLDPRWGYVKNITKEAHLVAETVPGEFFERMGDNFCKSNPDLYK